MEAEIKGRIEKTVRRILAESDMEEVTESKIRKQVVESFLEEEQQHPQEEAAKEYDDDGDLIICKLSGSTIERMAENFLLPKESV